MGGHILTQRAWDIAFGIYVTAELNMEPALLYCSMCGAVDKAYTKDVLQRRYLAEDDEELQLSWPSLDATGKTYGTKSQPGSCNTRCTSG